VKEREREKNIEEESERKNPQTKVERSNSIEIMRNRGIKRKKDEKMKD